jgi:hypothetical protein
MRRTSRTPRHLPYSIHQQLNMYALAAGAVGVGLLALAQPAGAKIVYTPTKVQLITGQDIYVDLDHDGTNDFYFVGQQSQKTSSGFAFLAISPEPGTNRNGIWAVESNGHACAVELPPGKRVGSGRPFQANSVGLFFRSWGWTGGTSHCDWWKNLGSHYVGLKFNIQGKIHYGWARVKVVSYPQYAAILTGYAYETIPNQPIVTGKTKGRDEIRIHGTDAALTTPTHEPASLGLLAMGSSGLSIWRREEQLAAQ